MRKVVLASASPRRRELLEKIGLKFEVDPSDFAEAASGDLEPHIQAKQLSLAKAKTTAEKYPDAIIIAADTFGVLDGQIIGKPRTGSAAKKMLRMLSGRSHLVITGFTIMDTGSGKHISRSIETKVYFRTLTDAEIDDYVSTGEPLDKAGAYAIQELGAIFIKKIVGDYYNVIGLPLCAVTESLKQFGIRVL